MSLLRRRGMMEYRNKDEWDIKLFPDDTGEIQAEEVIPPQTAKGFIIEVDVTVRYKGYVYDARNIVGSFAVQAYGAYFATGITTLDRSSLFSDNDSVGNGNRMSVGGNRSLAERVNANYLYLKWIY